MGAARSLVLAGIVATACACGAGGGDGGASGPFPLAVDQATVAGSPLVAARTSSPGAFAADYLRDANFTSLVVEVDYPAGEPPSDLVLSLLRDRLAERCRKPDGVVVALDDAIDPDEFPGVADEGDLRDLEDRHRGSYSDLGTQVAAMYVLLLPSAGDGEGREGMPLGLAYRGGSLAVFLPEVLSQSSVYVTASEVLGTALIHEVGHLLGLVNHGVPMVEDHEDPDHRGHSSDPSSVLWFAPSTPRVRPNLGDPDFASFDAASVRDLQAFGGR